MSFSQREERRGDRLLDVLTDDAAGLRLIISRLGAEPISLARRSKSGDWTGFLYRDNDVSMPAKGWANHATVMGYYLHRLKDGHSLYRGREIKGGTHSFLRNKTWHLLSSAAGNGSLSYRITPDDFSAIEYPLKVSLDLVYKMNGEAVTVEFRFTNDEPELTAHVGFGLHPGFAATSFDSFEFTMPAGKYRRYFSPDNYLSGETEEIDFPGGPIPFPREQLPGSYILELVDVPNREFVYRDGASGREIEMDLTGVPFLTLWSDGGPFLCVEPCWGLTDAHQQQAFENKAGIQTIAPGGVLIARFSLNPRLVGVE
jgi:galactose mutarotase-like enzyme